MPGWLERTAMRARSGALLALIAAVTFLPALTAGPFADDDVLLLAQRGALPGPGGPLSAYRFFPENPALMAELRASGVVPWWGHPGLTLQFFRPLTSLTFAADALLVGPGQGFGLLAHLHSLLWVAALTLAARRLFQRLLSPGSADVAALLHALTAATAMSGAWVSARHTLVGGVCALMAVERHLAARRGEGAPAAAWAWFVAGLLASESALGAAAWVLVYEAAGATDGLRQRARALAPWAVTSLAFVIAYRLAGFGPRHSGSYLDPAHDPLGAAGMMLARAAALAATGLLAAPAELATRPGGTPLLAGVGVAALALTAGLTWALRREIADRDLNALRWAVPAGLLATAPGLLGILGGRLLVVGGPALIAWVAVLAAAAGRATPGLAVRAGMGFLLLPALGSGPLQRAFVAARLGQIEAEIEHVGAAAEAACAPGDDVLVLGASDYGVATYVGVAALRARGTTPWRSWRALTLVADDVRVTTLDGGRVEVRTASQPLYEGDFERVYADVPPPPGAPIDAGPIRVTPGADARSFIVAFPEGVIPKTACFVRFDGTGVQRLTLGAPGASVDVARAIGPMER